MTQTETTTRETDRRLNLLVGLVVAAAATVLVGCLWWLGGHPGGGLSAALALTMFIAVCSGTGPLVRIRANRHQLTSTDAAVLIGLGTLPSPTVIVCTALGVAIAKGALRAPPVKIAFNAAKDALAAGSAALVVSLLGGLPADGGELRMFGLLCVAAIAFAMVSEAVVVPAIAFATRTSISQRLRANWDIRLALLGAWTTLGFLGLLLTRRDDQIILVVPLVILCVQLAHATRLRSRAEREAWQKLAQSTDEFNGVELNGVLVTAVTRAAELFSADEVEVELGSAAGRPRLVRGDSEGVRYDGPPSLAPPASGKLITALLESHGTKTDLGELRLRFRGQVNLSEREHYTLRTFASALCTAVRNASAYAELARLAAQHAHDAAHDPLTGLPNRRRLLDAGSRALQERPVRGITALLLIDLNHFKEVNDTLGHTAGDDVLIEVARRLRIETGEDDIVARLGGDEFAVFLRGLTAPAVAAHRAQGLLATLAQPIDLDGLLIGIEASIGIATAPSRGGMDELMRRADIAMYEAKRNGQRTAVYSRAMDTADISRLALGGDLPRAVAEQEITVSFQPIVDLATGETVAAEALARWQHPERGSLDPRRFLETVERSGLLPAFADAVLNQALLAATTWREAGFELPVAVNVSPRSLLDRRFPAAVSARLRAHDVRPERLTLELTENLTLSQLEIVDEVLAALRDIGVRLALDDFGTGYSSLAMLSRIPVNELKIDRDFVSAMDTSAEAAAVVRSTVDLARSLDLVVVAEGVENEQQRRTLWEIGCVAGQGHLFSRPLAAPQLLATLRRGTGGRPGVLSPPLHRAGRVIRIPSRRVGERDAEERLPHRPA
ncbi:MAG TPA: bifunctional diguanylate cyclase/phosphodiesterase [Micromonosporaceae bacterium]|nr:bifunctional diguanylate cyclase/phosphodiesterase [Micromonosporaceae bacterium]